MPQSTSFEPNFTGKVPKEWLVYTEGEHVRVKGWVFRITKANRFRLVLEPLPKAEVEALMAETLLRVKHSQLVSDLKEATVDIQGKARTADELRTGGEGIDTPGAGVVPEGASVEGAVDPVQASTSRENDVS